MSAKADHALAEADFCVNVSVCRYMCVREREKRKQVKKEYRPRLKAKGKLLAEAGIRADGTWKWYKGNQKESTN